MIAHLDILGRLHLTETQKKIKEETLQASTKYPQSY